MPHSLASALMIALDLAMIAYTLWILGLAGVRRRLMTGLGSATLGWLGVLHVLISNQLLIPTHISGPAFLALVFAFVGLAGMAGFATPIRRIIRGLGTEHLLLLQGIRVFFGAGFLALTAGDQLPSPFGLIDGFTHVSAGFLGLLAAAIYLRARAQGGQSRAMQWLANLFGLADILIVASTLALVLLREVTPFHPMMYAVFLPAPIWLWLHVISIGRLLATRS